MSEPDTSGTSQDPSLPGEGEYNQPTKEETLEERAVDDLLDEGYSPPEYDPLKGVALTQQEQVEGEGLIERLDREEPEVWEEEPTPAPQAEPDRAGRIEALPDDDDPTDELGESQSVLASDVGVAGGAATAEEAAMRVRDEDEVGGLTDEGSSV